MGSDRDAPGVLSLRTRALFAYADQRIADREYLVAQAIRTCNRVLGVTPNIVGAGDGEVHLVEDELEFKFEIRLRASGGGSPESSNAGVAGIHEEEVHELCVKSGPVWHPIENLAGLGKIVKLMDQLGRFKQPAVEAVVRASDYPELVDG
jgi:hypothetical protein